MKRTYQRGEMYYADLGRGVGSEQEGRRPVVIIQNDVGNKHSPTVIVLAITSRFHKKRHLPTHVPIESGDLSKDSIALAEQVRTIDKSRLIHYVGRASRETMDFVDDALKVSMGVQ